MPNNESDCVEDPTTGMVYCRVCKEASGNGASITWILRNSWKKHLTSNVHLGIVQRAEEATASTAAMSLHYREIYSMADTFLRTPAVPDSFPARHPHFRPILDEDTNGIGPEDFEMGDHDFAPWPEEDLVRANNDEILRREVELMMLAHLEDEFDGGDDQTIPNLTQEMRANSKWKSE
jgi:hypothetical protein